MLRIHLPELDRPGATVLAVGAHADDIEIGAGGTLLRLRAAHPEVRLEWLVCSAAGERREEAQAAAIAFGADAVTILSFTDRFLPAEWRELKDALGEHAHGMRQCDLVLAPWRGDRHQDHRTVAELVWQTFRSQPVWAYEIAKYEGDLGHPNLYVPLTEEEMGEKVDRLTAVFPSQRGHGWFDDEAFRGIARVRGVECGERWAESFHVEKMTW